jgi:hypothetical protein
MCLSCGCGEGLDDHGSSDNITVETMKDSFTDEDLRKAAEAQGISVEEVRRNLEAAAKKRS